MLFFSIKTEVNWVPGANNRDLSHLHSTTQDRWVYGKKEDRWSTLPSECQAQVVTNGQSEICEEWVYIGFVIIHCYW